MKTIAERIHAALWNDMEEHFNLDHDCIVPSDEYGLWRERWIDLIEAELRRTNAPAYIPTPDEDPAI